MWAEVWAGWWAEVLVGEWGGRCGERLGRLLVDFPRSLITQLRREDGSLMWAEVWAEQWAEAWVGVLVGASRHSGLSPS